MSYQRATERNRRLRKLYDETKNSYGAGAGKNEKRYYRYSCHNRDFKRICRRSTRRLLKQHGLEPPSREKSGYKKLFDYWWALL